jgi:fucose permease
LFWLFAAAGVSVIVFSLFLKLPEVHLNKDEKIGTFKTTLSVIKDKSSILYFIGVLLYVGMEIGIANWVSKYLSVYYRIDPKTVGAQIVSLFWGLFTAGTALSLFLLKFFNHKKILIVTSVIASAFLLISMFGTEKTALVMFPLTGFVIAPQWPIIFSLGMNSTEKNHGTVSGILSAGVMGGALIPFIIGVLGDSFGLKTGMLVLFGCLSYILSIGVWAKPVVQFAK